jgi:predicted dehydrogenase
MNLKTEPGISRRSFIEKSATVGMSAVAGVSLLKYGRGANYDKIRVGLVGCGGRGSKAARDAVLAGPNIELVAIGDIFQSQIEKGLERLSRFKTEDKEPLPGINVPPDRRFDGLNAYKKVIDSGIDYVLLCTPPGFRPDHMEYAVEKGVHIFAEKPCATDPPGIRRILALEPEIKRKGLGVLAGFNGRHVFHYQEAVEKIQAGLIGDITSLHCYFNTWNIWYRDREPGMSLPEYHFYNWFHVDWLCGDHIVEQHVHNLDRCNWVMQGHPIKAYGAGGRQFHTDRGGNIYDHFMVEYEYADGTRMVSMCRQIAETERRVAEHVIGTKGTVILEGDNPRIITDRATPLEEHPGQHESHWQEHIDFVEALRNGKIVNDTRILCDSTLTAIMGRESAYSGKTVEWQEILNSKLNLTPPDISAWDGKIRPVPKPGVSRA